MIAVNDVIARLDGVRQSARGWTARCPVPTHADRRPSLSVARRPRGGALLHCFGGCSYREVLAALGLESATPVQPRHALQPASVRALALDIASRQAWANPLTRELYDVSDAIRARFRAADRLQRAATLAGSTPAAWRALALAADCEREARQLEMALDEALARSWPR